MSGEDIHSWDVTVAIRDVSLDISRHTSAGSIPDQEELKRWLEWLNRAARAHHDLELACEDLVENGVNDATVEAVKGALAHSQGQGTYWPRKDRW